MKVEYSIVELNPADFINNCTEVEIKGEAVNSGAAISEIEQLISSDDEQSNCSINVNDGAGIPIDASDHKDNDDNGSIEQLQNVECSSCWLGSISQRRCER